MSVKCPQGHENPDGSLFCDSCGEALSSVSPIATPAPTNSSSDPGGMVTCTSCGATNAAGEAFCSNCGVSLQDAPALVNMSAPVPPPPAPPAAPVAVPSTGVATATQARLIVEADNQEFDLSSKDTITIGREDAVSNIYPDVDLTPHGGEEGGVSRLHARIFVENGQYMLEDLNSTNFTFLNRQRLLAKTPTQMHDNDEVRLGRVLLRFKTP